MSAVKSYGHVGRIAHVDLSSRKIWSEATAKYAPTVLGGRGINAKILYQGTAPSTGALSPENLLIFGTGPLVGTTCPSSGRVTITAKSPATELYGESNFGGDWGPELKFAGYDHLVIHGRSEKPVYMWIYDGVIEIKDARAIWGADTFRSRELLLELVDDPDAKVISIGPAGENEVRFACVRHQVKHTAGRPGMGAVMGSKRLKAVAVRGSGSVQVGRPDELLEATERIAASIKAHPNYAARTRLAEGACGLGGVADSEEPFGHIVGGNFQTLMLSDYPKQGIEKLCLKYGLRMTGCYNCPVGCFPFLSVPGVGSSEFGCTPQIAWSWGVLNPDPKLAFELSVLSNRLGMDSVSTASVIAFAIDIYKKGILTREDSDGMELKFGERDTLITLMGKIARREGLGNLLAEGVMRAAQKIGKGAEYYAHHAKGLEIASEDPRVVPGVALGFAVGPRTDTTRGMVPTEKVDIDPSLDQKGREEVLAALKDQYGSDKVGHLTEYEGKERVLIRYENNIAMLDIIGMCKFLGLFASGYVPGFIGEEECARLYSCTTGLDTTAEQLLRAAEAVVTLERAYNVRCGISRANDKIPERFFKEPVADGRHKGALLDPTRFERLKDLYYKARGWDVSTGIPSSERLRELGLEDAVLTYAQRAQKLAPNED